MCRSEEQKLNRKQDKVQYTYDGNWENDEMHGYGVETWSNGLIYEGYFRNGLKQPRGVLKFGDGDVYEGEFDQNKL